MNEEEIKKGIELLKKSVDDNHKISEHCYYFDEHQMGRLRQETFKLADALNQEKEKNKKLEETLNNLAKAVKFMGTNNKLTIDDIIKMFSPEEIKMNFDDFIKRWEKEQHKESNLKNKIIDLMAEDIVHDRSIEVMEITCKSHEECYQEGEGIKSCEECAKEYYYKKARGEEDEQM